MKYSAGGNLGLIWKAMYPDRTFDVWSAVSRDNGRTQDRSGQPRDLAAIHPRTGQLPVRGQSVLSRYRPRVPARRVGRQSRRVPGDVVRPCSSLGLLSLRTSSQGNPMPARLSLGAVVVGITTLGAAALTARLRAHPCSRRRRTPKRCGPSSTSVRRRPSRTTRTGLWTKGRYHLFYQQRVFVGATGLSCCDWGHAVSRDLVRWEQRPVAIHRVPASETTPVEAIFSGSAVVDWKNTSGFGSRGNPPLVAIYTGARPGARPSSLPTAWTKARRGRSTPATLWSTSSPGRSATPKCSGTSP